MKIQGKDTGNLNTSIKLQKGDNWAYFSSSFLCNCHGSTFSNDGKRISGPATRDLSQKAITIEDDVITFK